MNNLRLLVSVTAITLLVIAAIAFNYVTTPNDETVSSDGTAHTVKKVGDSVAALPQQEGSPAENIVDTPYRGPVVQYIGSVEKYDNSLLGENARIYEDYDDETLTILADGGDLLAIKVLAGRLTDNIPSYDSNLDAEENRRIHKEYVEKRNRYYELSLVYGDMELLNTAAIMLLGRFDPRDSTELRSKAIGQLAYLEFAAMRGMQTKKYLEAPWVIKSYNEKFATPLTLSQEEKVLIRERAKAIYDDLEAKRRALNLGAFEDIKESYYEIPGYNPTQDYVNAMGENAF